jgi:hypothetical protein
MMNYNYSNNNILSMFDFNWKKRKQCHSSGETPVTVTGKFIQLTEFKNVPEMLKYKWEKIMKIKLQNFEIYTSYQHINCYTIWSSDTKLQNTLTFLLRVKARKWKQDTKLELQPKTWNSWDTGRTHSIYYQGNEDKILNKFWNKAPTKRNT